MTVTHPHDLTKALSSLVKDGFLESAGATRGTFYFFPGEAPDAEVDLVRQSHRLSEKTNREELFSEFALDEIDSDHLAPSCDHLESLKALAASVREKGKVPRSEIMEETILKLCQGRFLTHRQLEELLGRSSNTLRARYLSKMIKRGQLELRYPDKPTHPEQGYRTRD